MATVIIKDNTREGKWLLNLIKGHKSVTVVESNDTAFEMPSGREMTINPSPSGDPFWNNPHNVEELKRRLEDYHSGRSKATPYNAEEFKKRFGL